MIFSKFGDLIENLKNTKILKHFIANSNIIEFDPE